MTIDYIQLSDTDYSQRRFQVISLVECKGGKPNPTPYRDSDDKWDGSIY